MFDPTPTQSTRRPGLTSSIALLVVQVLLSLVGLVLVYGGQFQFDRCGSASACNFSAAAVALWLMLLGSAALLVGSLMGVIALWRHRKASWWVPLLAVICVGILILVATGTTSSAVPS